MCWNEMRNGPLLRNGFRTSLETLINCANCVCGGYDNARNTIWALIASENWSVVIFLVCRHWGITMVNYAIESLECGCRKRLCFLSVWCFTCTPDSLLRHMAQILVFGFHWWVEKPCYKWKKTPLVIGGTRTQVLADSMAIAVSALNHYTT